MTSRTSLSSFSSSASTYFSQARAEQQADDRSFASTSTLINPEPPLTLIFDRNSVISAILYARTSPAYKITTNRSVTRTQLCDMTDQRIVATIKRRELFPDLVVFPHRREKSLRVSKWLKRRKIQQAQGRPRTTVSDLMTPSAGFVWRSDDRHRLALYSPDQTETPVAYSKMLEEPRTITLVITNCSDIVKIEIITSFLVLEHKLRMKEKMMEGGSLYGVGGQFIMMH